MILSDKGDSMEKKKNFIINIIFYLIIFGIIIAVSRYILPVLIPFILAFLVACILQYPAGKLCAGSIKRKKVFTILFVVIFYIIIFIVVIGLGAKLLTTAGNLAISFPSLYKNEILPLLTDLSNKLEASTASMDVVISQKIESTFHDITQNLGQYVSDFSMNSVKMLSEKAAGIPTFIVKLVVTIVATFFIAADFDKIIFFLKKLIPKGKGDFAESIVNYVKSIIFIYLKSYSLLFFLTFMELVIGLLIFQIPYAVLIALAISIFDILPVLGTGGILLPWVIILVVIGNIPLAIGILVLYLIITAIRNTLEPRIVGNQIGLHPLATLIAMFIGLKLLGIIGLVSFPVALSVLVNLKKNGVIKFKMANGEIYENS